MASRGEINKGALKGEPINDFKPLNLNGIEWFPDLETWLKKWMLKKTILLKPE